MLEIPSLITQLIDSGRWPLTAQDAVAQNLNSLASPERIATLAPEEDRLYLYPPPFATVRDAVKTNGYWNHRHLAPHEINFELSIVIGDFGLGSDAPILLDYRASPTDPRVIRLKWSDDGESNCWVGMAVDISRLVDVLGL